MRPGFHRPRDETALGGLVAEAFATRSGIAVLGGGSLAGIGHPVEAMAAVCTDEMRGITLHEPAELVIGARAGTPLADIVEALERKGQMLPFEPADYRALLGTGASVPTIGGVVAANLSGPRRIMVGACRDSLIGVRFVNGRGEAIKSGGRVMKNVTGYDLSKLMAGSWGTLGIVTEATFKVLPRPETSGSIAWNGLADDAALALMSSALGSPYEVSAAAHVPAAPGRPARTVLRLETFAHSVAYRGDRLATDLAPHGRADRLDEAASVAFWREIADVAPLHAAGPAIWRVSVAPSRAPAVLETVRAAGEADHFYDWGGGLVWIATPEAAPSARAVRPAAAARGGHATLIRGSDAFRREVGAFAVPSGALGAVTARVKATFDPAGILNPGRMGS